MKDRLGKTISEGDWLLYPVELAGTETLTYHKGKVSEIIDQTGYGFLMETVALTVPDSDELMYKRPNICVVMDETDPDVTLFLLENSVGEFGIMKDRLGNLIQIGDQVAFFHRPLHSRSTELIFGKVAGMTSNRVQISKAPDLGYSKTSDQCVILDPSDPRVTVFLLENSIS